MLANLILINVLGPGAGVPALEPLPRPLAVMTIPDACALIPDVPDYLVCDGPNGVVSLCPIRGGQCKAAHETVLIKR